MSGELVSYLDLVRDAYNGKLKLPAFQRDWKWQRNQVILLYDSIRQKYPIGSFMFLTQGPQVNLSPKSFRGSKSNSIVQNPNRLVLDGQQRITAGIELFYGSGKSHYFLSVFTLYEIFESGEYDINSKASRERFLYDLSAEDGYVVAKPTSIDPDSLLLKRGLLFTKHLLDDVDYTKALNKICDAKPHLREFCDYVIRPSFRPSQDIIVPVTNIGEEATVEAICRIFATLNTTGKILTPFEIVAAVLYPAEIDLQGDIEVARVSYPYYSRMDPNGELLLQTIALFDGKDTKKSALPKTINAENYSLYMNEAAKYLDAAGKLMTDRAGIGLDRSSELLVYPVIFPPMAWVLRWIDSQGFPHEKQTAAQRKLVRWFYGSMLSRRYQQSTHSKQASDKAEITNWISGYEDSQIPQWLIEVEIPKTFANAAPGAAISKMVMCLINANSPKDPLEDKIVGVSSAAVPSAKHHIFPTRFMQYVHNWSAQDSNNTILNIMFVSEKTNAAWNNANPSDQLAQAKQAGTNVHATFGRQFIDHRCLNLLGKPAKSKSDFLDFIALRQSLIDAYLMEWGFKKSIVEEMEEDVEEME